MVRTIPGSGRFAKSGMNVTRFVGFWIVWTCFLLSSQPVLAQESHTVKGLVLDENQKPLFGAYVILKNTTTGTTTDVNGEFALKVPAGKQTLAISYLGSKPQDITVEKGGNVKVVLSGGDITLGETVVVGYAQQKSKALWEPSHKPPGKYSNEPVAYIV